MRQFKAQEAESRAHQPARPPRSPRLASRRRYVCEPFSEFALGSSQASFRARGAAAALGFGGAGGTGSAKDRRLIGESADRSADSLELDPKMRELFPGYADSTLRCLQTVDEEAVNIDLMVMLIGHITKECAFYEMH